MLLPSAAVAVVLCERMKRDGDKLSRGIHDQD
jgi:hypothetical protein